MACALSTEIAGGWPSWLWLEIFTLFKVFIYNIHAEYVWDMLVSARSVYPGCKNKRSSVSSNISPHQGMCQHLNHLGPWEIHSFTFCPWNVLDLFNSFPWI